MKKKHFNPFKYKKVLDWKIQYWIKVKKTHLLRFQKMYYFILLLKKAPLMTCWQLSLYISTQFAVQLYSYISTQCDTVVLVYINTMRYSCPRIYQHNAVQLSSYISTQYGTVVLVYINTMTTVQLSSYISTLFGTVVLVYINTWRRIHLST